MSAEFNDLAALQGSWEQVAFEENGISNPPDAYGAPGAITTFHQSHFAVRTANGALLLEGTFELDDAAKTVDWTDTMGPDAARLYRRSTDWTAIASSSSRRTRARPDRRNFAPAPARPCPASYGGPQIVCHQVCPSFPLPLRERTQNLALGEAQRSQVLRFC